MAVAGCVVSPPLGSQHLSSPTSANALDDGNETAVALFDGEVVETPDVVWLFQQQRKAQEERGDVECLTLPVDRTDVVDGVLPLWLSDGVLDAVCVASVAADGTTTAAVAVESSG
jgi:hypothetical protein